MGVGGFPESLAGSLSEFDRPGSQWDCIAATVVPDGTQASGSKP